MTKIEIQKALYKQKPDANFKFIRMGIAYYYTDIEEKRIQFEIPVTDMGTADFNRCMPAKELVRWIIE